MIEALIGNAVLIFIILLIASPVIALIAWLEVRGSKRTTCKYCKKQLAKPGGSGIAWLGMGFCKQCVTNILKRTTWL